MKHGNLEERIEKYLSGTLAADEVAQLEQELANDPELAAEVKSQFLATVALERKGDEELKSVIKGWANEQFDEKKAQGVNKLRRPISWLAIAAVIALLITLAVVLNSAGPGNPQELYAQHFTELRFPGDRSSTSEVDSLWNLARNSYGNQDFEAALSSLNQLLSENPDGQAFLYKGICLLKLNRPQEAVTAFEQVPTQHLDYQRARWYRALSLLKAEDLPMATTALQEIVDMDAHYKKADAQEILDLL